MATNRSPAGTRRLRSSGSQRPTESGDVTALRLPTVAALEELGCHGASSRQEVSELLAFAEAEIQKLPRDRAHRSDGNPDALARSLSELARDSSSRAVGSHRPVGQRELDRLAYDRYFNVRRASGEPVRLLALALLQVFYELESESLAGHSLSPIEVSVLETGLWSLARHLRTASQEEVAECA